MKIIIFLVSISLFGAGVSLSFLNQVSGAIATYGAGVLTLIFAFLSEFKTFKGLGIEAELLDKKIEEADDLISRLRNISIPLAEMLLSSTARMGRIGTIMPRRQKYDLLKKIEDELRQCGVTDKQLETTKMDWHYYNLFDLSSPAFDVINEYNRKHKKKINDELNEFGKTSITPERRSDHDELCERNRMVYEDKKRFDAVHQSRSNGFLDETILNFVSESIVFTKEEKQEILNEIDDSLKDIKFYIDNQEFRRPDVWFDENEEY